MPRQGDVEEGQADEFESILPSSPQRSRATERAEPPRPLPKPPPVHQRGKQSEKQLRAELGAMKLSALKKRAKEASVDEAKLEDADDEGDIKGAVIDLIVDKEREQSSAAAILDEFAATTPQLQDPGDKAQETQVTAHFISQPCTRFKVG